MPETKAKKPTEEKVREIKAAKQLRVKMAKVGPSKYIIITMRGRLRIGGSGAGAKPRAVGGISSELWGASVGVYEMKGVTFNGN